MAATRKYNKVIINKVKRYYSQGISLRRIMELTGVRSSTTIRLWCDPEYKQKHEDYSREWRVKNKDAWSEINRRAVKKYELKSKKKK